MNLEDLVDENGLKQDEWSLMAPTFGKEGQLTVVGWSGRNDTGNKFYIVRCSYCKNDAELFGEGYFKVRKSGLVNLSQLPCGCSKSVRWSRAQYEILCARQAVELGHTFLGFVGKWRGNRTKITMSCEEHGQWDTGNIDNLISSTKGCPKCKAGEVSKANTKPDYLMVESFFASGAFHPDTKFWRSDRKDKQGYTPYWFMSCPDCDGTGESISHNLQKGQRPCECSKHRQLECYINIISNDNESAAIKFGISSNTRQRVSAQNAKSTYTVKHHCTYIFASVDACKKAESECKHSLECGVIQKKNMEDGYTETTWCYNMSKILQIYERNGGKLLWILGKQQH